MKPNVSYGYRCLGFGDARATPVDLRFPPRMSLNSPMHTLNVNVPLCVREH